MLCQNCGKYEATTHIKQVVNGEYTQAHLCSSCASKLGYGDMFSDFGMDFGNLFGSLFSTDSKHLAAKEVRRCPTCGMSFEEIAKSGRIGCADCYDKFYELLLPSIRRIHGKTQHNGKIAQQSSESSEPSKEEILDGLNEEMKKAIEEQNFELAAEIRDKIKSLNETEEK